MPSLRSVRDFENGYWYLDQLKNFAEGIGIPKDYVSWVKARAKAGRSHIS
jgi:hypothetical protein